MFILRLLGVSAREPRPDDDDGDEMLRSQLVAGLRPGPVQVELQKLLRRDPTLKLADVSSEAKAVEQEQDHHAEEDSARRTFISPPAPVPVKYVDEWREVREALKAEVLAKVKEQMSTLKEGILREIRQQFRETQRPQPGPRGGPNRSNWGNQGRRRERPLRWDDQGQPICLRCDRPGHMQRDCPQRQVPPQDF